MAFSRLARVASRELHDDGMIGDDQYRVRRVQRQRLRIDQIVEANVSHTLQRPLRAHTADRLLLLVIDRQLQMRIEVPGIEHAQLVATGVARLRARSSASGMCPPGIAHTLEPMVFSTLTPRPGAWPSARIETRPADRAVVAAS